MYYKVEISGVDTSKLKTLKMTKPTNYCDGHMPGIEKRVTGWWKAT